MNEGAGAGRRVIPIWRDPSSNRAKFLGKGFAWAPQGRSRWARRQDCARVTMVPRETPTPGIFIVHASTPCACGVAAPVGLLDPTAWRIAQPVYFTNALVKYVSCRADRVGASRDKVAFAKGKTDISDLDFFLAKYLG